MKDDFDEKYEKKEQVLFKKVNLGFAFIFIFICGIAIVLFMTSYLNKKVSEFTTTSAVAQSR